MEEQPLVAAPQGEGFNYVKDPNIYANHLHGLYGNPGTDNIACDAPIESGVPCSRGDNIFQDVYPGQCADYQYDIASVHAPGNLWCVKFPPLRKCLCFGGHCSGNCDRIGCNH